MRVIPFSGLEKDNKMRNICKTLTAVSGTEKALKVIEINKRGKGRAVEWGRH